MGYKVLAKDKISELVEKVGKDTDVFAPIAQGIEVKWSLIDDPKKILFDFKNTSLSPKGLFFPQTECLFEFKNDPNADHKKIDRFKIEEKTK
jgi:hypothetical protein